MTRKGKSLIPGPLLVAGAAALGYAGVRALLGLKPGAEEGFFVWTGPTAKGVDVGSAKIDLPIMYYRDDSFWGIFSAAYEPVRALLPSEDLHPVTLPGGRAVVLVAALNYLQTSVAPYGEVGIAIACTHGQPGPPLVPLLLEDRYPGWGGFIAHLPVTTRVALDGGRVIWGYAKFVADMAFEKRPAYQRVKLSERGAHILTLTVQQRGLPLRDNRPLVLYSVLDGELIKTTIPSRAVYQLGMGPGLGSLELGDHDIADQLRELDVATSAAFTRNYLSRVSILPVGESLGPADRPYDGYRGEDRDYGRLTINYDDAGETFDLHANVKRET